MCFLEGTTFMQLILASQSPRRQELLALIGLTYTVVCSDVQESAPIGIQPDALVERLALEKARAIQPRYPEDCIIGADTIVYIDGNILGKPQDDAEAFRMLQTLQGRTHTVYTGVAVLTPEATDVCHEKTQVTFAAMTREEINWYISTGEQRDKAGAYGVQGLGAMFVERVAGNYFNVVGMPLPLLYRMLRKAGAIYIP